MERSVAGTGDDASARAAKELTKNDVKRALEQVALEPFSFTFFLAPEDRVAEQHSAQDIMAPFATSAIMSTGAHNTERHLPMRRRSPRTQSFARV